MIVAAVFRIFVKDQSPVSCNYQVIYSHQVAKFKNDIGKNRKCEQIVMCLTAKWLVHHFSVKNVTAERWIQKGLCHVLFLPKTEILAFIWSRLVNIADYYHDRTNNEPDEPFLHDGSFKISGAKPFKDSR